MLETDRDLYLAFARAMGLDYGWAVRLIDGQDQAALALARDLAAATNTKPQHWQEAGQGALRLMAVKLWAVKERQAGRLTRPALDVEHQEPRPRHCRGCD